MPEKQINIMPNGGIKKTKLSDVVRRFADLIDERASLIRVADPGGRVLQTLVKDMLGYAKLCGGKDLLGGEVVAVVAEQKLDQQRKVAR